MSKVIKNLTKNNKNNSEDSDDIFHHETAIFETNRFHYEDKENTPMTESEDDFYLVESNYYDIDDKNGDGEKLAKQYLEKIKSK